MPKLYSARVILKTLQKSGFNTISQKGSHIKLVKKTKDKALIVIVPNHKEVASGTFQSILKQAEMTREEFERSLK